MAIRNIPVLLVERHSGIFTAYQVGGPHHAMADSADDALSQLKEVLEWADRRDPDDFAEEFLRPSLLTVSVGVRPDLGDESNIQPSDDLVPLTVHAVQGFRESGLRLCVLPELGVSFSCHASDHLPSLVQHTVQRALKSASPFQVHQFLPGKSVVFEELKLKSTYKPRYFRHQTPLPVLTRIAEPLDAVGRSKQATSAAYQRDMEVQGLFGYLSTGSSSVLLVGEPGVGKTTVLLEAIRQLRRSSVDKDQPRHQPRYWRTTGGRILSGMAYLGEWQKRCDDLVGELSSINGVLCVESLRELIFAGASISPGQTLASDGVGAYLLSYLRTGHLRLVAEVTPAELLSCRQALPGLVELFQHVRLEPMDRVCGISALRAAANALELQHRKPIEDEGVVALVGLFRRFLPYRALPGAAAELLRREVQRLVKKAEAEPRSSQEPSSPSGLTQEMLVEGFLRETGLPDAIVRDEIRLTREQVRDALRARVVAQDSACDALASMVISFKGSLNDPGRPIGVYLLSGPTGVGKTELARTLASYLFGHGQSDGGDGHKTEKQGDGSDRFIRLDMSEYAGPGAAERLLTRPDGEPSELIQRVRRQPFVVVLFDEIEKAAPEVFDILLSVMDEGRLTDRFGRLTYFRSAVLLMTSNLGARRQEAAGFGGNAGEGMAPVGTEAEVMAFFRPEFFNRLDGVLTFQPLSPEAIRKIVRMELAQLERREGLSRRRIRLRGTERLEAWLARIGYHVKYGARPLQRTLESQVVVPVARYLLSHPTLEGVTLEVDCQGEDVTVTRHLA